MIPIDSRQIEQPFGWVNCANIHVFNLTGLGYGVPRFAG